MNTVDIGCFNALVLFCRRLVGVFANNGPLSSNGALKVLQLSDVLMLGVL